MMMTKPAKPQPERADTDESLRTERRRTDRAVAEKLVIAEKEADAVLQVARGVAEQVLEEARDKADQKLDEPSPAAAGVARGRQIEDSILKDEQTEAERALQLQRQESASLAALVPLERERTDRHLLTERGRADAALAHRDDFLGMVTHDIRNLLGGIALNAQLLGLEASDSEEGRRTIEATGRIRRYIARMNRLVGDLVDVASIDAGILALHPTRYDARALLLEAIDTFAPVATDKGISFTAGFIDDPLSAVLDHDRMFQVLANLVTNAIKFTSSGGTISLGGTRVGNDLHFFVQDSGQGVPPHMLEDIFERFWQVGKNDKRGLGLGLYISKCIVVAHGGTIWAESTLAAGSNFQFTIPVAGPAR